MQNRVLTRMLSLATLAWTAVLLPAQAQDLPAADAEPAEPPRYAVEIILFRYSRGATAGNELFLPDAPPLDAPEDAEPVIEFGDAAARGGNRESTTGELAEIALPAVSVNFTATPRSELVLDEVHRQLQQLDSYEPVLWAGWTQDAIGPELSPQIPLRRLGNAPPGFSGELQLYLNRFLHLVVDVTLAERQPDGAATSQRMPGLQPPINAGDAWTPRVRMRISEDRIMKNGDLRYFDHPKFGLLATVTRIEEPAEDAQPDLSSEIPSAR